MALQVKVDYLVGYVWRAGEHGSYYWRTPGAVYSAQRWDNETNAAESLWTYLRALRLVSRTVDHSEWARGW